MIWRAHCSASFGEGNEADPSIDELLCEMWCVSNPSYPTNLEKKGEERKTQISHQKNRVLIHYSLLPFPSLCCEHKKERESAKLSRVHRWWQFRFPLTRILSESDATQLALQLCASAFVLFCANLYAFLLCKCAVLWVCASRPFV